MATNFPGSLDDSSTLPDPGSGSLVSVVDHALLHDTENAAIKAVEAKVGTGATTPTSTNILRGNGANSSTWGKLVLTTDVTGTLPAANGGTGVTTNTGSGNNVLSTGPTLSGGTFGGSPTLATPTIADFTNSTHTHANTAGGGLLNGANAITDGTLTPNELVASSGSSWVWTNFTPTFAGFSVAPTAIGTRYTQIGKTVIVSYSCFGGTSNATSLTATLPITASTNSLGSYIRDTFNVRVQDSGTISSTPGLIEFDIGATVANVYFNGAGTNIWTNTGTKGFRAIVIYEGL